MVRNDKDILPLDQWQNAFHRLLDERILGTYLEQLFRHLLPESGQKRVPEPPAMMTANI